MLGGLCFILPGLVLILGLSVLFLARHPPRLVEGIAAGAGAGVPAVAVRAALGLVPASWARVKGARARETRWFAYLLLGCAAGAIDGQYLVLVLLGSGLIETVAVHRTPPEVAVAYAVSCRSVLPYRPSARLERSYGWRSRSAPCPTAAAS